MIVRLYGRPGCCLCDDAEAMLRELRGEFDFQVEKINIDDTDLRERWRCHIPVITFDGSHRLALRITPQRLRRSLERAQTQSP